MPLSLPFVSSNKYIRIKELIHHVLQTNFFLVPPQNYCCLPSSLSPIFGLLVVHCCLLGLPLPPVVGSHGPGRWWRSAFGSRVVCSPAALAVAIRRGVGAICLPVGSLGQRHLQHASVILGAVQRLHGGLGLVLALKVHKAVVVGSSRAPGALMGRDALANGGASLAYQS